MTQLAPSRPRLLIISPHCDDAVFACGALLQTYPGSTVVTICAAGPAPDGSLTEWDQSSGFQADDDVMAFRRGEDVRALSLLGAHALWLSFYDSHIETQRLALMWCGPCPWSLRPWLRIAWSFPWDSFTATIG